MTRICAAWLLKHATNPPTLPISYGKPRLLTSGRCSLIPILRLLGRGFLERTAESTITATTLLASHGARQRNVLWRMRRNWSRTRLKPCSPWVIINIGCCVITACQGHVRARQQDVTRQQRGAICPRSSYPAQGTVGSKRCLLGAGPRPGST